MQLYVVFLQHQVAVIISSKLLKTKFFDIVVARLLLVAHGQLGVDGCQHTGNTLIEAHGRFFLRHAQGIFLSVSHS